MKSEFFEYFKLSVKQFKQLWSNSIFSFDSSVFLNLYRYSDETRNTFIGLLAKIEEKIWVPHQCIYEYLNNRPKVINDQTTESKKAMEKFDGLIELFEASRTHPFVTQESLENLKAIKEVIDRELNTNMGIHNNRITNDDIRDRLSTILKGKIGDGFSAEEIEKVVSEGESRYSTKVPPGYMDKDKEDSNGQRKYGDYIIWKQLIMKSQSDNVDIIFVTDDRKEDWWLILNGKTIGPRPELLREFWEKTNHRVHIYTPDSFLKHADAQFKDTISAKVIKEVKENRPKRISHEEIPIYRDTYKFRNVNDQTNSKISLQKGVLVLDRISTLYEELLLLENERDVIFNHIASDENVNTDYSHYQELELRIKEKLDEIRLLESVLNQYKMRDLK